MQWRQLTLRARVSGVLLALAASPLSTAGETPLNGTGDTAKIIAGLRQVASELTDSIKQFQTHLDREIALHDQGYRSKDGRHIPGADADLIRGPADLALPTVQKLIAARMICARRSGYEPSALADSDRIQNLILEARNRVVLGNDAMRHLLMISAKELNTRADAESKTERGELLKARNTATEAAKKALAALPVDMPGADAPEDSVDRTWSLAATGLPVGKDGGTKSGGAPREPTHKDVALPIRFDRGKTITLVHERFRRVTLTDSGMEDGHGQHLFFQEDWEQRQGTTAVRRWAVAVNTTTGQHSLLRRYTTREFSGELDDVYQSYGRDSLSPAELSENSAPPSPGQILSATAEQARSREEIYDAVLNFRTQIREALVHNDRLLANQSKPALDEELPEAVRENLFAIRGHLGRANPVLDAEGRVRRAVERATESARSLEALAAWANGTALERDSPAGDSRELLAALNRSDTEIDLTRALEREALAALPPEGSKPEEQFPALKKDYIVRMRGSRSDAEEGGTIRCVQEVWRFGGSGKGGRQVERTIAFIDVDPATGNQIPVAREVKYYPVGTGDTLESIYDENAAQ